jgi:hypothetical protein
LAVVENYLRRVFVIDLTHFLDLPDGLPGPTIRLAKQLSLIVRAATSGPSGVAWTTVIRCAKRPGRRLCPGHLAVHRMEVPARIDWRCDSCGDDGMISNWEGSYFDLRGMRSEPFEMRTTVRLPIEDAPLLYEVMTLDPDVERMVFSVAIRDGHAEVVGTPDEIEELAGSVAFEANHEPNRRRERRLDGLFMLLNDAIR